MRCGSPTTGRSLLALATLVVAGAVGALGVLRAAPASAAADCVAVIVDFRQLGGSLQTGCAQGDPSNGLRALSKAGFGYTPRARDGLICQLAAKPACAATTSSTYWSYWYRAPGSSRWVYANDGPGTHNPKPGSTEAWVWQDGGRTPPPGTAAATICPQQEASPKPAPTPTKASPKPNHGSGGGSVTRSATTSSRRPSTRRARTTGAEGRSATATATQSPTPTPSSRSGGASAAAIDPEPTGGPGGARPGGAGLALGGILVLGIGTAAALRARRNSAP